MTTTIRTAATLIQFTFHTVTLTFAASLALVATVLCLQRFGLPIDFGPLLGATALCLGAVGGGVLAFVE